MWSRLYNKNSMPAASPLPQFENFGELLRHLRKRAGMTQRDLGQSVGYSEAHIARLESGIRLPDLIMVKGVLVEALDLQHEPEIAAQLAALASKARSEVEVDTTKTEAHLQAASARQLTNLPAQLTRFVGREREIADVRRLLGETRLLTIVGSGGAGKTRLSQRVASEMLTLFPEGVWFVALAALNDATLLADTTARALGLGLSSRTPLDVLVEHLRDKETLIVLDNCEHLIGACAKLAEVLLQSCLHLCILATSREALNIPGEMTWFMPAMAGDDAVDLFVERAVAARPDFTLSERERSKVQDLCRQLDGMPLAIELAAARLRVMSLDDIMAHLNNRMKLLAGGPRTAQPRQQTLRATLDWSHDLLSDPERITLRRLSVFSDGWLEDAAITVCADGQVIHADDVPDLVLQLAGKSLVTLNARAGGSRYLLLETLRQYEAEKLESAGETEAFRQRHLQWVIALCNDPRRDEDEATHHLWLHRLRDEMGNIRAALAWAEHTGDYNAAMRIMLPARELWHHHGQHAEAVRWIQRTALDLPDMPADLRAGALITAASFSSSMGNHDQAMLWVKEATPLAMRGDNDYLKADALNSAMIFTPEPDRAAQLFEQAEAVARRIGEPRRMATLYGLAGVRAQVYGDMASAGELLHQSLQLWEAEGDALEMARTRIRIAMSDLHVGHYESAQAHLEFAQELTRNMHLDVESADCNLFLGIAGVETGQHETARANLRSALSGYFAIGNMERTGQCLLYLARVAQAMRKLPEAAVLAAVARRMIDTQQSRRIYERNFTPHYERSMQVLLEGMTPDDYDAGVAESKDMTLEQAVSIAMRF
jgi:predicted ATPase/DNA-binding XRE family transcriptional regulator